MPLAKVEVAVEEAFNPPVKIKVLLIVEEELEINPERLAKPPTFKVEEADNGPLIFKLFEKVEEAVERTPDKVESPKAVMVPVAVRFVDVKFPEINALPSTPKVAPGVEVPIPRLL